ncbi:nucleotide pyrophosphatase [Agromyces rhizosphaerae]|uniref:Nucleotide pyrophosphatase n=1 Tax=Agromyces rhizosphaerae TaxID=88374 RepID=A0A9W6FSQ2_9MICO|nr:nucleotide pyrophosphatase/phosphodiesterase family protein [Agromyces rhizosphaerae]GLI28967.1 nucleotide pyrophosphatase [Agromyces rhizosphaerae]
MLPVAAPDAPRLTDVLASAIASVRGEPNRLGLGRADVAIVALVDGLGASNLRARAGHARRLSARFGRRDVVRTVFPSTTAAGITTFTTGLEPGEHGILGYRVFDAAGDRTVNLLSGWESERTDPLAWQPHPTLFDAAAAQGVRAVAVGPGRYRASGFTRAALRGAEYRAAESIEDRFAAAREVAEEGGPAVVYLYVPELDMAAHAVGWESDRWLAGLERVDAAFGELERRMPHGTGLLVTADHGVVDVPAHKHVLIDRDPALVEGIRHVAGDPRCLYLTFDAGLGTDQREALVARWRAAEEHRAWVLTREEAVAAGAFGPVASDVESRIGDLVVAARSLVAYYDGRDPNPAPRAMVGQHGSATDEEARVPLIRAGAYAR